MAMIKNEYYKLKNNIIKNLNKVDIDMEAFREYVQDIFYIGDSLSEADDVKKIFRILTEKKIWKFNDVTELEMIVEMFSADMETENMELINAYQASLNGYKAAAKIKDFIAPDKENDDENDKETEEQTYSSVSESEKSHDVKYRTELSVKLLGNKTASVKISLESLKYIEKVWNSISVEFNLPSLPHILDKIVEGCVVVHWIVHHDIVRKLLEGITDAMEFFERECIGNLHLEKVCVYDQEAGVANHKVLAMV